MVHLATKTTLATTVILGILLALLASSHTSRVLELHEKSLAEDMVIFTQSVAIAANTISDLGSEAAVRSYIEHTNLRRDRFSVEWLSEEQLSDKQVQSLQSQGFSQPQRTEGGFESVIRVAGPDAPHYVRIARPVETDDVLQTLAITQLLNVVLLLILFVLVARIAMRRLVEAPIRQLIAHAKAVGEGDYSPREQLRQRNDEVGALACEMNTMAHKLEEARKETQAAEKKRAELLDQLRHADRLSTVGKIMSGVAHELGTPLNVISGKAQLLCNEDSQEKREKHVRVIVDQVQHMAGIIRQLLDYSRRKVVKSNKVDIHEVIHQARDLLQPSAADHDVNITIKNGVGLEVKVDAGKILQVLTNLMNNGIQAMPQGGDLTVTYDTTHVDSPPDKHASGGDFVRLEVKDTGMGIPKEKKDKIFESFYTTKEEGKGTGLVPRFSDFDR